MAFSRPDGLKGGTVPIPSVDRHAAILLSLVLLSYGGTACNTTAMSHPLPIASRLPVDENREIVLETLATHGWFVETDEGQEVVARYSRYDHLARVRIAYSGPEITMSYAGSENLRCAPVAGGCSTIHVTYNRWVDELRKQLVLRAETRSNPK